MIIPPYDDKHFAFTRLLGALKRRCIPLIHKTCAVDDFFKNREEWFSIFKNSELFIDKDDIVNKIKFLDYEKIISELIGCNDYKKLKIFDFYKSYFDKLNFDLCK